MLLRHRKRDGRRHVVCFQDLPQDLVLYMLRFLHGQDLIQALLVSSFWRNALTSTFAQRILWQNHVLDNLQEVEREERNYLRNFNELWAEEETLISYTQTVQRESLLNEFAKSSERGTTSTWMSLFGVVTSVRGFLINTRKQKHFLDAVQLMDEFVTIITLCLLLGSLVLEACRACFLNHLQTVLLLVAWDAALGFMFYVRFISNCISLTSIFGLSFHNLNSARSPAAYTLLRRMAMVALWTCFAACVARFVAQLQLSTSLYVAVTPRFIQQWVARKHSTFRAAAP